MAVSNYCTVEEVRAFVRDPDINVTVLGMLVGPISRAVDRYCRRFFYSLTGSESYDREDGYALRLRSDLVSITEVEDTSGQTWDGDDFFYEPLEGPPYSRISIKQSVGTAFGYSDTTKRAITITGTWGYASVPDEIKLATILWIADFYQRSDVAGLKSISSDAVSATMREASEPGDPPDDCLLFLNPRRKIRVKGLG